MFEAILTLCVALDAGPCRDLLLPGYEAQTESACLASLQARKPDPARFEPLVPSRDGPRCQRVGELLEFDEVAPGLLVHRGDVAEPNRDNRGDVANIAIVIGDARVAVIDTGSARWIGEAIWRSIRARTDKPVSHVILTHLHPDHVLGAAVLAESGAQVVGHAELSRALSDRQSNYLESLDRLIGPENFLGTTVAQVDIGVEDVLDIDLGQRILELRAWPRAHTGTDLTVLDRATDMLLAGDLVFDEHVPALDGRLVGWREVLSELQAMDHAHLVPGHGGPVLDWPEDAEDLDRYLAMLERDTRAAIDAGLRLSEAVVEIGRSEADRWSLFEAYNARNATVSFTELEWE